MAASGALGTPYLCTRALTRKARNINPPSARANYIWLRSAAFFRGGFDGVVGIRDVAMVSRCRETPAHQNSDEGAPVPKAGVGAGCTAVGGWGGGEGVLFFCTPLYWMLRRPCPSITGMRAQRPGYVIGNTRTRHLVTCYPPRGLAPLQQGPYVQG